MRKKIYNNNLSDIENELKEKKFQPQWLEWAVQGGSIKTIQLLGHLQKTKGIPPSNILLNSALSRIQKNADNMKGIDPFCFMHCIYKIYLESSPGKSDKKILPALLPRPQLAESIKIFASMISKSLSEERPLSHYFLPYNFPLYQPDSIKSSPIDQLSASDTKKIITAVFSKVPPLTALILSQYKPVNTEDVVTLQSRFSKNSNGSHLPLRSKTTEISRI